MKKLLAPILALMILLTACGSPNAADVTDSGDNPTPASKEKTELEFWTYPVGGWASESTVSSLISAFNQEHPEISISMKILSYSDGDEVMEKAIADGNMPDIVFEGPERLTANWGARGLMVDLGDIWESESSDEIYSSVVSACIGSDGSRYIYPLCMTTHCMAVNRDLMEAAGAWQYVDEEHHTWTTEGFVAAVKALRDYGVERVGEVYCGGQGGDQGTRALVNNLYSGSFTNPEHTRYTFNSPENIRALELLRSLDGIEFSKDTVGTDNIERFCSGELAMCFCWNVGAEVTQTINNPDRDFDIFPLTFPTDDGVFDLQGGIWGFGVFNNGDEAKIEAAKTFIRFLTEDTDRYTQAVLSSTFWPVRDLPNIYENDALMSEYFILREFLGDYYQVTPGWADARTAWWTMLQSIADGADIAEAAAEFENSANAGTLADNEQK